MTTDAEADRISDDRFAVFVLTQSRKTHKYPRAVRRARDNDLDGDPITERRWIIVTAEAPEDRQEGEYQSADEIHDQGEVVTSGPWIRNQSAEKLRANGREKAKRMLGLVREGYPRS